MRVVKLRFSFLSSVLLQNVDLTKKKQKNNMNDVKLAVLGGPGTGKSESIYNKHLCLEGKQLNLEIYDPCSQPQKARFSLTSELHWADGFVIVYDISDRSSFAFAKALIYRIREPQTSHCKRAMESAVLLVGNKQDLCHVREVGWEEGQKLALDNRCQFCELSAAEQSLEVEMMFIRVLKDILTNFKLKEKRRSSGSKSMAKLINNVFGKRRKSV
ncbi:ras-related and estrogen-regulated growth inhibitor-like protein isoform X2 [Phyllostomus hastatus]|uniref:ras-related and estrogen-regulated growth inhibitor-like protein isoform X2 n=1 Tax=Phyllostomus hastatus TaxID=9423 RepID=UPI001E6843AE|nr:ras-related and estrogen-regulated growth inhibitor-like protein isoform X2 [Phyllostomus hastatus]